ncbi:putative oxidoreductase [Flavobacterium gillisiae]|uniref:Putative oxidoreductase n=1 Tax=Flavobacterium gillisiae TaxID=150146 RepID=A0A1H3ZTD3_9FLAO|nr:DoxX family protein [Flavobacterium gillisiae]SEA26875.1 putative oxidoreductase [Flavobacterium gillisiae]
MSKNTDLGLLILRIAVGALMLLHGIAKLGDVSFIEGMLSGKGLPSILAYGVYVTEIVAPLLIVVGYRTRLAALVFIFGNLFAFFLVHTAELFLLNDNGGWQLELLGLYLFGALTLFFTGGGKMAASSSNKWD